ncbi:nucleoside phosphorylase [Paramagnetospirillum marisnigri]|uniref:Nucleoside phosphorylase n=1 Tax=Paramagnetospirillum marisnigri TaxID=1285242 RepID=A0A178MR54_9PROT|nr:nucleoside phosphorylase [Paramagnetospirillum marisnigri]OAN51356.1 nucleoside phosphorylase [Paramagnetospirillum marisnigri]
MTVGVIVGMTSEAALIPPGPKLACAGAVPARAESLAQALLDQGAHALISIGIAGGLDPALEPGAVVVGSGVHVDGAVVACDGAWASRLLSVIPFSRAGLVFGADRVIGGTEAKHRLFTDHGAVIVDMESGAVARVAARAGIPLAVLRTVADPASRSLPRAAMAALDEDGNPRIGAVLAGLARRPWELAGLIRVGLDSRAALSALRDSLKIVGPTLGV